MPPSIEKVSGLEVLAAAGVPVPRKRLHLSADQLREPPPEVLGAFLEDLPIQRYASSLLARSAHPLEDQFTSGAFTSPGLELNPDEPNTPASVWARIQVLHERMIAAAQPAASLQIRRDLRHKGIEGYAAKDMGVLLNEAISTSKHLTLVPVEGGMRVQFQPDDLPMEYDFEKPDPYVKGKLESPDLFKGRFTADQLKAEVEKANAAFGAAKEYEVLVDTQGQLCFVQVRTPQTQAAQDLSRLTEWDKGIQSYQQWNRTARSGTTSPFLLARAASAPEVRSTQLLIIDEKEWSYEGSEGVQKNYARLIGLAEEIRDYSLWVRNLSVTGAMRRHPLLAWREQIAACASVQIRGRSDRDSGVESASPHVPIGLNGPRQVGIHYTDGNLDRELSDRKDGDPLTVLLKEGKVSLI